MFVRQYSRRTVVAGLLLTIALPISPAAADALDDLRIAGALGEGFDGFLVVRDSKATGAKAMAKKVNAKRRKIYAERAKQEGVPVAQIGAVYAREIMERAPKGTWFQNKSGKWTRSK